MFYTVFVDEFLGLFYLFFVMIYKILENKANDSCDREKWFGAQLSNLVRQF